MTIPHDLLNDLCSSTADLTRKVEAMVREGRPNVMILRYAVTSLGTSDAVSVGQGRRLVDSAKRGRDPLGTGGPGAHGSSPFDCSAPTWASIRNLRRADPVITRATERLTHAFNDEKAYFVDRRP